jgi:alginate O-acetyltransferase complex protein AlgJ
LIAVQDSLSLPAVPLAASGAHPRRDRIVAACFAIAVAVPGLALFSTWSHTITRFENRPMAAWPDLAFSRNATAQFDRAVADRFGGRDTLVREHHAALLAVFGTSALATVLPGRNGWFYWLGEDGRSLERHFRGTTPVVQFEIDASVDEFERRRAWLAGRRIAYVVVLVPEKFTIYPEYLPDWVAPGPAPTPYDRLVASSARHSGLTLLDLRPALRAAKSTARVYYQTDSHWNYNGAVIGYDAIMRAVQQALPTGALPVIAPAPQPQFVRGVDFFSGDLGQMLGLPSRVREDDVAPLAKVLGSADTRCARRTDHDEFPGFEFHGCTRPGLPRAVVLRDSMAIPLIPLLSENFSRVVYVSSRKLDRALIEREKPDIVIDELVERSLHAPGVLRME